VGFDAFDFGAAWVFTRASGVWSQQGAKLIGTGVSGTGRHPRLSVALPGRKYGLVGGVEDNAEYGATWVFTRSDGVWIQQGGKLAHGRRLQAKAGLLPCPVDGNTASSAPLLIAISAAPEQCLYLEERRRVDSARRRNRWERRCARFSVALSADGNTALVGDPADNGWLGAAYVFTRNGDVWSQQAKLVGASAIAPPARVRPPQFRGWEHGHHRRAC
jgi:hypothetical protein